MFKGIKIHQECWLESVPMVRLSKYFDQKQLAVTTGTLDRKNELIVYRYDGRKEMMWFKYRGDRRFSHDWHTLLLRKRKHMMFVCPFCWSDSPRMYIYKKGIRCSHCLILASRWNQQYERTRVYRDMLKSKQYEDFAKILIAGRPKEVFNCMQAMELMGHSANKFTLKQQHLPWRHKKCRR